MSIITLDNDKIIDVDINTDNASLSSTHVAFMVVDGNKTCWPSNSPFYGELDKNTLIIFGTTASIFFGSIVEGSYTNTSIKFKMKIHPNLDNYLFIINNYLTSESRIKAGIKNLLGEASKRAWDDIMRGNSDLKMTSKDVNLALVYAAGLDFDDMVTVSYYDLRQKPQSTLALAKKLLDGRKSWHLDFIYPLIDGGYHTELVDEDRLHVDISTLDQLLLSPHERYCHERGYVFLGFQPKNDAV